MLQPVKKESREDGEAGLGGQPEIDYKIWFQKLEV